MTEFCIDKIGNMNYLIKCPASEENSSNDLLLMCGGFFAFTFYTAYKYFENDFCRCPSLNGLPYFNNLCPYFKKTEEQSSSNELIQIQPKRQVRFSNEISEIISDIEYSEDDISSNSDYVVIDSDNENEEL